eukprot:scaffold527_cov368-Prasinococcus_capsulatus_cf.AAC.38
MTVGASFFARAKAALTYRTLSPCHFDTTLEGSKDRKQAPHSAAVALARRDLPVPGGPNRRTPLQALARPPLENTSGKSSGKCTASLSAALASFKAPTSESDVVTSSGRITWRKRVRSKEFPGRIHCCVPLSHRDNMFMPYRISSSLRITSRRLVHETTSSWML